MEQKNINLKDNSPSLGGVGEDNSPSLGGVGEALKILVIQQKMIGDVLVSSLICENLKLNYPKAKIYYLVNRFTLPVIENNPFIDHVVVFEDEFRSNKIEFLKFLLKIRSSKYDVIIDAYGKLESNLITLFSGAKTKISWKKSYTKFIYTKVIDKLKVAKTSAGLAVEDRINLLSSFEIEEPKAIQPKIYLTRQEKQDAKEKLITHHIDLSIPIVMVSILGSDPSKSYPAAYMASLLDHFAKYNKVQFIFNYTKHQHKEALYIYDLCESHTQKRVFLSLTPSSLRQFMATCHHCDALIGNEGGSVNMAKALDVPTFSIFSPWIDKKVWGSFEDKKNTSVHLDELKPNYYKEIKYKSLKPVSESYYKELSVEYVKNKLDSFWKNVKD